MDTKLKKYNGRRKICFLGCLASTISGAALIIILAQIIVYNSNLWLLSEHGIQSARKDVATGLIDEAVMAMDELWIIEVALIAICLIGVLIAIIFAGEKDENGKIILNVWDRVFTEVHLALLGGAIAGISGGGFLSYHLGINSFWFKRVYDLVEKYLDDHMYYHPYSMFEDVYPEWITYVLTAAVLAASIAAGMIAIVSLVKKLKTRTLLKTTILGAILVTIWRAFKASDEVTLKVMALLLGIVILSASWLGFIPAVIIILLLVPKNLTKYKEIRNAVNHIRGGDLGYKIDLKEGSNGELDRLANSINQISDASKVAFENEYKSTKMKTELISNVSHDLKTPLTSMISYVDLIKSEGLDSENAPMYLDIVQEKTLRLKKLTEDLFEAAKASSGAIPVEMQSIEMVSIVNQALAEVGEKLDSRNLDVIFTNKAERAHVNADGQLLWRVIENLLVNVSKYALPFSRVYIDIVDHGDSMTLEVKNMSEAQLNISADELMERFQRGDASRNTEGSGLGLSIAKDLTELMNGVFEIFIDGDLFKATVTLEKAEMI